MANELKVGDKVRSFDFQSRKDCYIEGVLEAVGPAPKVCPGSCEHYHIRITRQVWADNEIFDWKVNGATHVYPALNWSYVEKA